MQDSFGMHVIGYTREAPPAAVAEPAFSQHERMRRFASEQGHRLIAVCSDVHAADGSDVRPGMRAALAIIDSGAASTLMVASLDALAADMVGQETLLAQLRSRGADLVSTEPDDEKHLTEPPADAARAELRATLQRIEAVRRTIG